VYSLQFGCDAIPIYKTRVLATVNPTTEIEKIKQASNSRKVARNKPRKRDSSHVLVFHSKCRWILPSEESMERPMVLVHRVPHRAGQHACSNDSIIRALRRHSHPNSSRDRVAHDMRPVLVRCSDWFAVRVVRMESGFLLGAHFIEGWSRPRWGCTREGKGVLRRRRYPLCRCPLPTLSLCPPSVLSWLYSQTTRLL